MLENIDIKTWWIIGSLAAIIFIGVLALVVVSANQIFKDEKDGNKKGW